MEQVRFEHATGVYHHERIGRPDVWHDQRTRYHVDMEEFDKSNNERRRILSGLPIKYKTTITEEDSMEPVVFEEEEHVQDQ